MRLTAPGPRSLRRESREGGAKIWSSQNTTAPAEGLLSRVSQFCPRCWVGNYPRTPLIRKYDPSYKEKSVTGCGGNQSGLLKFTFSHFDRCHRCAEHDQQRHGGQIRVLKNRGFSFLGVVPCPRSRRGLTVMTLLNAPGCRPEFHLRHLNLS